MKRQTQGRLVLPKKLTRRLSDADPKVDKQICDGEEFEFDIDEDGLCEDLQEGSQSLRANGIEADRQR